MTRIKFEVLGKHGWAVAYCRAGLIYQNVSMFCQYGYSVRIEGTVYEPAQKKAA